MHLSNEHFFFSSSQDIIEIAKALKKFDITYFTYTRIEKNGSRIYLTTCPDRLKHYFKYAEYLIGNSEKHPSKYSSEIVLWSTLPHQHLYETLRDMGHGYGMFMFEPNNEYCETYGFATRPGNHSILNTYLTNLEALKKFTSYFKEQATHIIKQADKNKIILPFNNNGNTSDKFSKKEIINDDSTAKIKLTHRQFSCGNLLLAGKTYKEIAIDLNLSPRTIETYIDNLKLKLHCRNKAELIAKLLKIVN